MATQREEYIPFYRRSAFYHGLFFSSLIYAIALISYSLEPDWMCMYYVKQADINPQGFFYLGLMLYVIPFAMGFSLGFELHKNSFLTVAMVMILALIAQVLVVLSLWERYWWVGTYDQFYQNTTTPLSQHPQLILITLGGGAVLLIYFALLARYYWKQRWEGYMAPGVVVHAFYPSQIKVVQALGNHFFEPIATPSLLEKERLGRKMSEYMSTFPWINQVVVSGLIEFIQILPIFVLFKPRFFTSLSHKDKDRFLEKLENSKIATLHYMILVLKTLLSLLYYEEEGVFREFILQDSSELES